MKRDSGEVPGNAMASQAAFAQGMIRTGQQLQAVERILDALDDEDIVVTNINVTCPGAGRADYLVIVKAERQGEKIVGFHDAPTFREALEGVVNRLQNRTMKFKEDRPYVPGKS